MRTSLALSMIGVLIAQLYRLQHSLIPSTTFGYFVISKPLAAIFEIAAIVLVLLGAYRSWRQQNAMARGKVWVGGWEIWWIMSVFHPLGEAASVFKVQYSYMEL
ncbi:hypothetical protein LTR50_006292 [Elasticomyces elasticus]|nr:hypothetical protein LTR50_006292 [Elasticomyces elasticus]